MSARHADPADVPKIRAAGFRTVAEALPSAERLADLHRVPVFVARDGATYRLTAVRPDDPAGFVVPYARAYRGGLEIAK